MRRGHWWPLFSDHPGRKLGLSKVFKKIFQTRNLLLTLLLPDPIPASFSLLEPAAKLDSSAVAVYVE